MQVNPPQPPLDASKLPLEALATNSRLSQGQKLTEVSRQFEAVLLRQILGEAQKPAFPSSFADSSVAGDIYRDLMTQQMADQISRSGSIGLARSLSQQLQHQLKTGEKPSAPDPGSSPTKVPAGQRTTL
jgi:flagellar protein FlgJ